MLQRFRRPQAFRELEISILDTILDSKQNWDFKQGGLKIKYLFQNKTDLHFSYLC
jgi:hypothetical protein